MRIGFDATPMQASWGGIRRYTESLLHALVRVDAEHAYVLFGRPVTALPDLPFERFRWSPIEFPYKRLLDTYYVAGAAGAIDLYHGTNYFAPLWARYPRVVTVHDLTVQLFPETHPPARRLKHRLLGPVCRRAARVIADSHSTKQDLTRLFGIDPEKIDVIHLAVDPRFAPMCCEESRARVRSRYGLPDAFLLFVGAVEPRKNLRELIGAVALLREIRNACPLVIAGSASADERVALEARIRQEGLTLGRDVIMPGFVAEEDLPVLYSMCALFVYPSLYEGFGLPPLEALACGAAVVLPRNSSLEEIFAGCVFFVDWSSAESIARAIETALGDSALRAQHALRGRELATRRSWDDVARETLATYQRAIVG